MKLLRQFTLIALLGTTASCAFFNDRVVDISIGSNPPGADIFIEGRSYGRTPATFKIEPKEYTVTLTKEGYGSTNFKTPIWWGTMREDVNGARTADGTRCFLDMMTIIFSFNAYNAAKCGDFKQKQHFVTIPYLGANAGNVGGNSIIGLGGNPANMIDYYYNQDMINNPSAAQYQVPQQQYRR